MNDKAQNIGGRTTGFSELLGSRRDYLTPRERLTDPAYNSDLAQATRAMVDQMQEAGSMPAWRADNLYSRAALASKVGGKKVPTSEEMRIVQVDTSPDSSDEWRVTMPDIGEHGRAVVTYRPDGDKVRLSIHGKLLKGTGEFGLPAILLNADHNLFGTQPYKQKELEAVQKAVHEQINNNPPPAYQRMVERLKSVNFGKKVN